MRLIAECIESIWDVGGGGYLRALIDGSNPTWAKMRATAPVLKGDDRCKWWTFNTRGEVQLIGLPVDPENLETVYRVDFDRPFGAPVNRYLEIKWVPAVGEMRITLPDGWYSQQFKDSADYTNGYISFPFQATDFLTWEYTYQHDSFNPLGVRWELDIRSPDVRSWKEPAFGGTITPIDGPGHDGQWDVTYSIFNNQVGQLGIFPTDVFDLNNWRNLWFSYIT
jgi:hypothetical protein